MKQLVNTTRTGSAIALLVFAFNCANACGNVLYWTTGLEIQRAGLDGSGRQTLVYHGNLGPHGLALDAAGGMMYWTNAMSIQRSALDGSGVEQLVDCFGHSNADLELDLDARKMYWIDLGWGEIRRANMDGTDVEVLISGLGFKSYISAGIALDTVAGKMYWTEAAAPGGGQDTIRRANLDGSNVEDVVTGLSYPFGIALDPMQNAMYFTSDDAIYRAALDGSNSQVIVEVAQTGRHLAIDHENGHLYWSEVREGGFILRCNMDGSEIQTVIANGAVPVDLALGPVPEPSTMLLLALGGSVMARRRQLIRTN